jgi:hypothetical protein
MVEHSALMMGKKSAVPAGTVQLGLGLGAPPKNHTGPDCPALQSAVPNSGLESKGSEKNHCHHRALHSPYDNP